MAVRADVCLASAGTAPDESYTQKTCSSVADYADLQQASINLSIDDIPEQDTI
jgi:hypothetical protein